jgi:hypothetical protein
LSAILEGDEVLVHRFYRRRFAPRATLTGFRRVRSTLRIPPVTKFPHRIVLFLRLRVVGLVRLGVLVLRSAVLETNRCFLSIVVASINCS